MPVTCEGSGQGGRLQRGVLYPRAMSEMTAADRALYGARQSFVQFAEVVYGATRFVREGSEADGDRERAASRLVPVSLVDNYVASVADHLLAWAQKAGHGADEPILRLSLYSDYTLLRPVLESLAAAIWILGPDDRDQRVKHAVVLANVERAKGQKYVQDLAAAGTPDGDLKGSIAALDRDLRAVCARMELDAERLLGGALDPSSLTRKASQYVPGPTLDLFRHWAICSAHAHAQMMTVLTRASRTEGNGPRGDWTYAEADSENLEEVVRFIGMLLNILVDLLNRRGFVLDRSTPPAPPSSS